MLAILNRYKALLVVFVLIALAALIWLFVSGQSNNKVPSKGVFVMERGWFRLL